MKPSAQRLEELKAGVLERGVPADVVASLEVELADRPLQLARELILLRDEGTVKQRLQRAGFLDREPEDPDADGRPDFSEDERPNW